jgi:hypothetical protein
MYKNAQNDVVKTKIESPLLEEMYIARENPEVLQTR